MITVAVHFLIGYPHAQPDVPTPNDRLVAIIDKYMEPQAGAHLRERIAGRGDAFAGGPTDTYSDFQSVHAYSPCVPRMRGMSIKPAHPSVIVGAQAGSRGLLRV